MQLKIALKQTHFFFSLEKGTSLNLDLWQQFEKYFKTSHTHTKTGTRF